MINVKYGAPTQFESLGRNGFSPTHGAVVYRDGATAVAVSPMLKSGEAQRGYVLISTPHAHEVCSAILQEAKSPWVLRPARSDAEILQQTRSITDIILRLAGFEVPPDTNYAESPSVRLQAVWQAACQIQDMLTQSEVPDAE